MFFSSVSEEYARFLRHELGKSPNTCVGYASWLRHFAKWRESQGIEDALTECFTTPVLRRYLLHLSGRKVRPRTIRSAFSPLRGLALWCVENGLLPESPVHCIRLPRKDAARRLLVSSEEVRGLLVACERLYPASEATQARALLSVLVFCGLRFSELLDLNIQDWNADKGVILVRQGKGRKSRLLYPPPPCREALAEWVRARALIGVRHDWLWAQDRGRRLGEMGARRLLERVKATAGYAGRENIKPHSLRHAFATRLMENGATIKTIQAALGHSEAATTMAYLHMAEEPARAMSEYAKLNIPQEVKGSESCNTNGRKSLRKSVRSRRSGVRSPW